jgi:hypothetical protein
MLAAASQNVSQYFTLDAACYGGCLETGASNCVETCQLQNFEVTGTGAPPTFSGSPTPQKQLIAGVKNEYLLIAAAILGVVVVSR